MLKQLLEKRSKGEQLTDEELAILKEYDENILEAQSKIALELENLKTKFTNADTELQNKLKEIENLQNTNKSLESSKKSLEEIVNKSENIEDVKIKLRTELENEKKEALEKENKRVQEMLDEIKKDNETKLSALKAQFEEQKIYNDKLQFKSLIKDEIIKRPYMESQLNKLYNEVDESDLNQSKFLFNFLISSVNHENEMEQYKKKQETGKNIFKLNLDDKDKELEIKNQKDLEFEEFLKRNPNIR